jgi:hypothetical protein
VLKSFGRNTWREELLGRPKRKWEDYSLMDNKAVGWDHWRAVLNTVMNRRIPWVTPWNKALETLIVTQLVKKFHPFYGTRRFITVSTTTGHWPLSWARCIQSAPSLPLSLRFILILFSHALLGLPNDLFPSGFPIKILYAFFVSPVPATCLAHLFKTDFVLRKLVGNIICL